MHHNTKRLMALATWADRDVQRTDYVLRERGDNRVKIACCPPIRPITERDALYHPDDDVKTFEYKRVVEGFVSFDKDYRIYKIVCDIDGTEEIISQYVERFR